MVFVGVLGMHIYSLVSLVKKFVMVWSCPRLEVSIGNYAMAMTKRTWHQHSTILPYYHTAPCPWLLRPTYTITFTITITRIHCSHSAVPHNTTTGLWQHTTLLGGAKQYRATIPCYYCCVVGHQWARTFVSIEARTGHDVRRAGVKATIARLRFVNP